MSNPATNDRLAETGSVFHVLGLTKVYRMGDVEVHALRGIDLELQAGEFIVILGPSGSGKSTLLNIIGGLDVPTSGSIVYRDHDLTQADEHELTQFRREHVGFIFQFYIDIFNIIRENQFLRELTIHVSYTSK